MKGYITPKLNFVGLRLEERFASNSAGSCTPDQVAKVHEMADYSIDKVVISVRRKGKEVNRMKKYIIPKIAYTDLGADERVCTCTYE